MPPSTPLSSTPASHVSASLSAFYRAHPNAITGAAAATAAVGFAAYHYGGFAQLWGAVSGQVRREAPRLPFKEEQLLRHVFARAAQINPQSVLDVMEVEDPVDDGRGR